MFYFSLGKKPTPKPRDVFPTGEILTYLKRLHSDSVFIFLFHDFNDFSHQLVRYVINMPATLRENRTKNLMVIPLKNKYGYLFKTLSVVFATLNNYLSLTYMHLQIARNINDEGHGISLTKCTKKRVTFVVAMLLTKLTCWKPFSLRVKHTSHREFTSSWITFSSLPVSSTLSFR